MGYTRGHLHDYVEGQTRMSFSIYKHYNLQHNSEMPEYTMPEIGSCFLTFFSTDDFSTCKKNNGNF